MKARTLMVQGTTSNAGKSTLVTGLCRIYARRGFQVAPFKPQNMALNSAVTLDGGEIGRAQAVQAQACGLPPHTDMNPLLLKPNTDTGAQVIIQGKAILNLDARGFHDYKPQAMEAVLDSYHRLSSQYDTVIVEGAGSPAEINLRTNDIANMGFAEKVDCPVLLVADIDRGGVFAHIVGTLELLSDTERARVVGFVINRFRGDIGLLQPGLNWLEERTGKPVLGVLPYLHDLYLEAEDALPAPMYSDTENLFRVVVPRLPRISNHTDFDYMRLHPQVQLEFLGEVTESVNADLMVLPGSKSVCRDLDWLHTNGWVATIQRHLRYGGKIIGICGGFQMLGSKIHDPRGVEGPAGNCEGLGLLDFETTLQPGKELHHVQGKLLVGDVSVSGYEIHAGCSTGAALKHAAIQLPNRLDGAVSSDNQILGTYIHGLFDAPESGKALLRWAGLKSPTVLDMAVLREEGIDRIADSIEKAIGWEQLRNVREIS